MKSKSWGCKVTATHFAFGFFFFLAWLHFNPSNVFARRRMACFQIAKHIGFEASPLPESFSERSRDYWCGRELPVWFDFKKASKGMKLKFENGVPVYESFPQVKGRSYSDYAKSFARDHPLDKMMLAECKRQMEITKAKTKEIYDKIDRGEKPETNVSFETQALELGNRYQYYQEMARAMSGEGLPFPQQGYEAVEAFLRREGKRTVWIDEAHIRLRRAEEAAKLTDDLIGEIKLKQGAYPFVLIKEFEEHLAEAKFYSYLLDQAEKLSKPLRKAE